MAKKKAWKADEVVALLRDRYGKTGQGGKSNRYVFLEQVAPQTGFSARATWIDAMAISMWPSDGLYREAFEVKVSRSDFLNEINNPIKNHWFKTHCHMFWYVTAPDVVAAADEIPENCGWMLAQKNRLVVKKQATVKQMENTISADFFAAVARAMETEHNQSRRDVEKEILTTHPEIQKLRQWKDGTIRFINNRVSKEPIVPWQDDADLATWVFDQLCLAAGEEPGSHLREHVDGRLRKLRDTMTGMLVELVPFVASVLHEVDEQGRYLNNGYRHDEKPFKICADILERSRSRYSSFTREDAKEQAAFIQRLIELGRELNEPAKGATS